MTSPEKVITTRIKQTVETPNSVETGDICLASLGISQKKKTKEVKYIYI